MGEWSQRYMAFIREQWTFELDAIGVEMVDAVREACNTPVEYTEFGVIRSERGDNPRREFGNLWASFDHRIEERGGSPVLIVSAGGDAAHYARRLHNDLNRPFFTHLKANWDERIGPRLRDCLFIPV